MYMCICVYTCIHTLSHPHERSGSQKCQLISGSLRFQPHLCEDFLFKFLPLRPLKPGSKINKWHVLSRGGRIIYIYIIIYMTKYYTF